MKVTYKFKLSCEKIANITFTEDAVKVKDVYLFNKKERKAIASYISNKCNQSGFQMTLSNKRIAGEMAFHSFMYKLGIKRKSAIDANIEYNGDPRWYVRLGSFIMSWFE